MNSLRNWNQFLNIRGVTTVKNPGGWVTAPYWTATVNMRGKMISATGFTEAEATKNAVDKAREWALSSK